MLRGRLHVVMVRRLGVPVSRVTGFPAPCRGTIFRKRTDERFLPPNGFSRRSVMGGKQGGTGVWTVSDGKGRSGRRWVPLLPYGLRWAKGRMFFRFLPFQDEGVLAFRQSRHVLRMQGRGTFFFGCGFFVVWGCHDATDGVSFVRAQGVAIVQTGANGYFIDRVCTFPAGVFLGGGKVWLERPIGILPVCRSGKKDVAARWGGEGRGYGQG
jgi:hypothetical protein